MVTAKDKKKRLREILLNGKGKIAPGAFDCLSALMIEKAGFELLGTTGYGMHGGILGTPDNGLLTFSEMVAAVDNMANCVDIPLLADAEGGYGNAINTYRTVQAFERAGAAGLFIEDQKLPPNCPFLKQAETISIEEMVGKIKAAVDARLDDNFVIVARTDAPFEEGMERLAKYHEAGADIVKFLPKSKEDLIKTPQYLKDIPLHLGIFPQQGFTEGYTAPMLGDMGYHIITYPFTILFAQVQSVLTVLRQLKDTGSDEIAREQMVDFADYVDLVRGQSFAEKEKKYLLMDNSQ